MWAKVLSGFLKTIFGIKINFKAGQKLLKDICWIMREDLVSKNGIWPVVCMINIFISFYSEFVLGETILIFNMIQQ